MGGLRLRPVPSSFYQMKQPTHQRPVHQSLYCYTMVCCSACGFNVPIKGLTGDGQGDVIHFLMLQLKDEFS